MVGSGLHRLMLGPRRLPRPFLCRHPYRSDDSQLSHWDDVWTCSRVLGRGIRLVGYARL